jgi:hypothetical protein
MLVFIVQESVICSDRDEERIWDTVECYTDAVLAEERILNEETINVMRGTQHQMAYRILLRTVKERV